MGTILSYFRSNNNKAPESKVILVTGASSGIGKECALTLLRRGHVVYGAARRVDNMQALLDAGGHAIQMDITKDDDIIQAVHRIIKEQGRIDVLVNSAGYYDPGPMEHVPKETVRHLFDVNLFGLAMLTKEVLPHMHKQSKGTIVNMSSIAGKVYGAGSAWYTASKHALEGWSDCLRLELHPFNIKVAIIEPGLVGKTEIFDSTREVLMERVKGTRYEGPAAKEQEGLDGMITMASDPSVIADLVVHASESSGPRRRYVAGFMAGPSLLMRNWLGDAFFDLLHLQMSK